MKRLMIFWLRAQLLAVSLLMVGAAGLTGLGGVAQAAEVRPSKPEVRKDVVAVIEGQLAAFRAGDTKKAYAFSATALRAQNPLRKFVGIVENNYPEIWKSTRSEIGLVRDDGTRATVLVQVYSAEGSAGYDYGLVKEKDGWRIDSVLRHAPKKDERL